MAKIGVIGAGVIGNVHIACMKQAVPKAEIIGVSDIDTERAAKVEQDFGIKAFESNAALLDTDVEAVFICTWPKAHKECVLEALDAGKHVFCEKPLAATLEEGREIARAVEASDKKFQIGYLFHYIPAAQKMKSLIDNGDLGDLVMGWGHRFMPFHPPAGSWYADPVGGGILDFCAHDIEMLAWLCGKPVSVSATGTTTFPDIECVDTTSIAMRFKTGIGAVLSSWAAQLPMMNIGITGTKGAVTLGHGAEGISVFVKIEGREEIRESAAGGPEGVMVAEDKAFIECITNDEEPSPGIEEGLMGLEIHDAVERSWKTGNSVTL